MINRESMEGAVIADDFEEVIYKIEDEDLYMIGTSEHAMAAMHSKEIIDGKELPLRYAGTVRVLEKRQVLMEGTKKEFSESINLTKLNNLYFQNLKTHGMNMKRCCKQ